MNLSYDFPHRHTAPSAADHPAISGMVYAESKIRFYLSEVNSDSATIGSTGDYSFRIDPLQRFGKYSLTKAEPMISSPACFL